MNENLYIVEEIIDPELVKKLLSAQTREEFATYYEEYTGKELEFVSLVEEGRRDNDVWRHFWNIASEKEDPNICITPEGWEIYIPS